MLIKHHTTVVEDSVSILLEALTEKAEALGTVAGEDAADWTAQNLWGGRVWSPTGAREQAVAFLDAHESGDPALFDKVRVPDLSGEFADAPTPKSLIAEVVPPGITLDPDTEEEICQAWLDAAEHAFWAALVASANGVVECFTC